MPTPEELKDILLEENRQITSKDQKINLPFSEKRADIDLESLSKYLIQTLINDEQDKLEADWARRRRQDLFYYYQMKDKFMSTFPWPNASNFPVPIIPVMLDVGHATIMGHLDIDKIVRVKGFGAEDSRVAVHREKLLKAQMREHVDTERIFDLNTFQTLLHGTSYVKVMQKIPVTNYGIDLALVPIENIYLPIDSEGPEIGKCDHATEIIPMSLQDIIIRAQLRNSRGRPFFENLDQVTPGWTIGGNQSQRELTELKDIVYGTSLSTKVTRDVYYWGETYITWYNAPGARPVELVVWWAPSTGAIFGYVINDVGVRPYADSYLYPNIGRAFHRSLPEILKNVQDKANYTDKQATDASDITISPETYIENDGGDFQAGRYRRYPTGVYPIQKGSSVHTLQRSISPIIERKQALENLWNLAGNVSSFSEPLQGVLPSRDITATTDVLRNKASNRRLGLILGRYGRFVKKVVRLIDHYNERFMPKKTASTILGVTEIESINELFPKKEDVLDQNNMRMQSGFNLNFFIQITTLEEQEIERQIEVEFYTGLINSLLGRDVGVFYRAMRRIAEVNEIKSFTDVVHRPLDAIALSGEQMIYRIMSGQVDVQPSIQVDPQPAIVEIQTFMRTASYREAPIEKKKAFETLMSKLELIKIFRGLSFNDFNTIQMGQQQIQAKQGQVAAGKDQPVLATV